MKNIGDKTLSLAFAGILFCISLTLLFYQHRSVNEALNQFNKNTEKIVVERVYEPVNKISSVDIISMLMTSLDYDIEVNDMYISRHNHRSVDLNYYSIESGFYTKTYAYDINGDITRVIYKRLK